jgi:hypothetical protein
MQRGVFILFPAFHLRYSNYLSTVTLKVPFVQLNPTSATGYKQTSVFF